DVLSRLVPGQVVVQRNQPLLAVDEVASPLLPGTEGIFLFHLSDRLALLAPVCDYSSGVFQYGEEVADIVKVGDGPVSRNHFHVRGKLRDDLLDGSDHAFYAAAAGEIDEWKSVGDEIIPHVYDV